jgi:hypothetical protein
MTDVLNSYLHQHKSINIPGVGSIYILNNPAINDFVNKRLFPGSYSYRFDKYNDVPAPDFYSYLARKNGITENEAMEWYQDFSSRIRSALNTDGYYMWPAVGQIKKDESGDLIIESQQRVLPALAPVSAKRVIRKDSKHAILVGDNEKTNVQMSEILLDTEAVEPERKRNTWMIYALILFLIAAGAIIFHFYTNGFTWRSTGNQEPLNLERSAR